MKAVKLYCSVLLCFLLASCSSIDHKIQALESDAAHLSNQAKQSVKTYASEESLAPINTIDLTKSDTDAKPNLSLPYDVTDSDKKELAKKSIYFAFDSFQIDHQYEAMVVAHAKYLKSHPKETLRIIGNTDEKGSRDYNVALGQKRAEIIRQALTMMGVHSSQIEAVSFGKEKPKALGHNEKAWAENRRSDLLYKSLGEF